MGFEEVDHPRQGFRRSGGGDAGFCDDLIRVQGNDAGELGSPAFDATVK